MKKNIGSAPAETKAVPLKKKGIKYYLRRDWQLYVMLLIPVAFALVFKFLPMLGLSIAFLDYKPIKGFAGSEFIGLQVFQKMFTSKNFYIVLRNTLVLNGLDLVLGFPAPIILAICLNEIKCKWFKKTTQTVMYLPHFLSWAIISAIAYQLFMPSSGYINVLITRMGGTAIPFLTEKYHWVVTYILIGVWQSMGWGTIIYLAAITGINGDLYEAATVDGAGRWHKIWNITLPCLKPTIVTLLIMNLGKIMGSSFERTYAMSNTNVMDFADVISTYVYRVGLKQNQYNISTAVGLFQSVVGVVLVIVSDRFAKALGEGGII